MAIKDEAGKYENIERSKVGYLEITASSYYFDTLRPFMSDMLLKCKSDEELIRTIEKTINTVDSACMSNDWALIDEIITYLNKPISDNSYFNSPRIKRATEEERSLIRELITKINEFKLILKYEKPSSVDNNKIKNRINYNPGNEKSPNGENKDFSTHNMKELNKPNPKERIPNI